MPTQNGSSKTAPPSPPFDFTIENFGSVFLVRCENELAKKAPAEFGEPDSQWFGDALVVEPRFIGSLVSSLREDGWRVG
jgi:hypothetical protein